MKNKVLKQNKGFTTADVAISIVIIMIFVAMITTVFYNFYLSTSAKNRNAIATNCIIDVIENAKLLNYEDVNNESLQKLISDKTVNIPNGFTVTTSVQKYNEIEGNEDKEDVIKLLTVKVEYSVGNKKESTQISTIITK